MSIIYSHTHTHTHYPFVSAYEEDIYIYIYVLYWILQRYMCIHVIYLDTSKAGCQSWYLYYAPYFCYAPPLFLVLSIDGDHDSC